MEAAGGKTVLDGHVYPVFIDGRLIVTIALFYLFTPIRMIILA
jgi:hypothetical protein